MLTPENDMSDDLLVSYLLEEADDITRQQVEQWIIEDPSNRRYFDHFRLIWENSKQIVVPTHINAQDSWEKFKQRTKSAESKPAILKNINTGLTRLKIAASIILIAGVIGMSYFIWTRSASAPVILATLNEAKTETLPDGSVITLNKNSEISYASALKGNKRKIKLKGEAFFNVVADKNKPFEVEVNNVIVTVLGTSFNIKTIDGGTEVIVETGMVQVMKNNSKVILKPQEKLLVENKDSVLQKEKSTDKLYNYYRTKEFVCDNTPLWKLVEILNEAYQVNIVIENKNLVNLPLTTTFYNEPLDNVLSVISETFNISIERDTNKIILK